MMATIKYMRIMQSKFTNTTPQKNSNRGARAGAGSAFDRCLPSLAVPRLELIDLATK